ncbi:hypothetical protein PS876_01609 [Pseudomonas fluorescens]|jgi:hypothetical protein|uniref:hypothetical protein n=1 Tax=Pseudomonas TaxID=286 RepID=UPI0012573229|nr:MULTISPECIES: hypothetical protein [Pseudomonas]MBX8623333.1 hypothetical protein [Pseudomonas glycinae]VVO77214.1 hypothetical protein PS876_01609 [Pseudomonas fluorescens]
MSKKIKKNTQALVFFACFVTAPPLVVTVKHSNDYDVASSHMTQYEIKLEMSSKVMEKK